MFIILASVLSTDYVLTLVLTVERNINTCGVTEEALGQGVNPPRSTVPARGWARARRDRAP